LPSKDTYLSQRDLELIKENYDKFHGNINLKRLLNNAKENAEFKEVALDKDKQ
jgi:hypothetical protein